MAPAHPRQGARLGSRLAPWAPAAPTIGRPTRRALLTPQQRGQVWSGARALSSARPPISPFSGPDQEAFK